jgi:DMSO reductase family type II enzyme chaperone
MEERTEDASELVENARARAGMYSFLANLFNQRPDLELVRRLREMGSEGMNIGVGQGEISQEVEEGLREMASFIDATQGQPEERVEQDLAVDWTRLFRGVSPSYGPPPPYEGVYIEGAGSPSDILQMIMQTYHKFSVDVDEQAANRPDYIGIELDFLRYLNESEADAWQEGDEEKARDFQGAQRDFLSRHLGRWVDKFCDRALQEAKTGFYRGFIRLTRGVLKEEMDSFR